MSKDGRADVYCFMDGKNIGKDVEITAAGAVEKVSDGLFRD